MKGSSLNSPVTMFTPRDIETIERLPPRLPNTDIISQSSVDVSSNNKAQTSKLCDDKTSTYSVSINNDNKTALHTHQVLNAATSNHSLTSNPTDIIIEAKDGKVDEPPHIISSDTNSIVITSSRADSYLYDSSDTLNTCLDGNIEFTEQVNDVASTTHERYISRKDRTKRGANNPFCPRKSELHYLAVADHFVEDFDDNEEMDEDY